jgi:ABC-type multidrug transport system fused ATPase/permease subunit
LDKELIVKSLEHQIHRLNERLKFLEKRSDKYSWNRLKIFISFLIVSVLLFSCAGFVFGWIIVAIGSSLFSITVHFHNKLVYAISRYKLYIDIKTSHLARVQLDWNKLPEPKETILNAHPFEIDLDLVGERSLHRILNITHSKEGSTLLRKYLLETDPDYSRVLKRQRLVNELTPLSLFRDKFLLKAVSVSRKRFEGEKIVNWLNNIETKKTSLLLLLTASALILSSAILFVLFSLGLITAVWLFPFVLYLIFYMWFSKRTEELFKSTELIDDELNKVRILFEHIENIPLSNRNEVRKFLSPIFKNEQRPSLLLKRLEKLSEMIAARGNPFIKIILNILMPWDVYLSIRLFKCRDEIKNNLPDWLNILYKLEALNSLANFAYLNPDFTFPEILQGDNSKYVFVSNNLGHPLIPESEKITNNFSLQKEKEIVIITGSNMSGKSTFIKTIGVNLCLAYAGAPVNADKLTVSLFRLFTCIKVTDSVTDGISYFYAEVKRLKELLDEAKVECLKPLFFLIDEIFSGTNNKERSIGSRAYIKALAELEVCGAVATHDLNLINLEKDIKCVSNFHFREDISNGKMVFDYKLHPGPCPTTNAIRVMQLAGLPVLSEQ